MKVLKGPDFHQTLRAALEDFIIGSGVERARLDLTVDGKDFSAEFLRSLADLGYIRTNVTAVDVRPGERVPAFYIERSTAYFGWVFWEKFTAKKSRKLWGSVVRNAKGDWAIQISLQKQIPIYANTAKKIEMDVENPG